MAAAAAGAGVGAMGGRIRFKTPLIAAAVVMPKGPSTPPPPTPVLQPVKEPEVPAPMPLLLVNDADETMHQFLISPFRVADPIAAAKTLAYIHGLFHNPPLYDKYFVVECLRVFSDHESKRRVANGIDEYNVHESARRHNAAIATYVKQLEGALPPYIPERYVVHADSAVHRDTLLTHVWYWDDFSAAFTLASELRLLVFRYSFECSRIRQYAVYPMCSTALTSIIGVRTPYMHRDVYLSSVIAGVIDADASSVAPTPGAGAELKLTDELLHDLINTDESLTRRPAIHEFTLYQWQRAAAAYRNTAEKMEEAMHGLKTVIRIIMMWRDWLHPVQQAVIDSLLKRFVPPIDPYSTNHNNHLLAVAKGAVFAK